MSTGALDLGTLYVKLSADIEDLKKGMSAAQGEVKKTGDSMKRMGEAAFGAVSGISGAFAGLGHKLEKSLSSFEKIFGEHGTAAGQAFGRKMADALNLSASDVKGLEQSVKSAAAAFTMLGQVGSLATSSFAAPLAIAVLTAGSLAVAAATVKVAWTEGFDSIRTFALVAIAATGGTFAPLAAIVYGAKLVKDQFDANKVAVGAFAKTVWDFASKIPQAFADAAKGMVEALASGVAQVLETFAAAFAWIEQHDPTGQLSGLGISSGAASAAGSIRSAAADFDPGGMMQRAFTAASEAVSAGTAAIKAELGTLAGEFKSGGSSVVGVLKGWAGDLSGAVGGLFRPGTTNAESASALDRERKANEESARMIREQAEQSADDAAKLEASQRAAEKASYAEWSEQRKLDMEATEAEREMYAEIAEQNAASAKAMQDAFDQAERAAAAQVAKDQEYWRGVAGGNIFDVSRDQYGNIEQGAGNTAAALGNFVAGKAVAQSEHLGTVLQGAAAGGEAGGPWGALIGAILGLLTETQGFKDLIAHIDGLLGTLIEALSPLMDQIVAAIGPLIDKIGGFLGSLFKSLAPAFNAIGSILAAICDLIGGILDSLGPLIKGIANLLNSILKAVAPIIDVIVKVIGDLFTSLEPLFEMIGDILTAIGDAIGGILECLGPILEIVGEIAKWTNPMTWIKEATKDSGGPAPTKGERKSRESANAAVGKDYMGREGRAEQSSYGQSAAKEKREANADVQEQRDVRENKKKEEQAAYWHDRMKEMDDARTSDANTALADSANKAAIELEKLADSVKNAPASYKLAGAEFAAWNGAAHEADGGGGGGGGGVETRSLVVNINSPDAATIWASLKDLMVRENFLRGGTSLARAPVGLLGG